MPKPRWQLAVRPRRRRRPTRRSSPVPTGPLHNPPVRPHPLGAQPDIEVRKADPEQAQPGPRHVPAVQAARTVVRLVQQWRLRDLVLKPADQVPERVAAKRIPAEQDHVDDEHKRANTDAERTFAGRCVSKPETIDRVIGENGEYEDGQIQEVPVKILKNKGQLLFAALVLSWFADGAGGRIHPERLVIRAAIVITGEPETGRGPEDEQGRGKNQPAWPPRRPPAEPRVRRIAEQFRRIER